MKFCFLIPAYKRAELTIECIDSIYMYEPNASIIFLDNGSQDNSYYTVVKRFSGHKNFQHYKIEKNIGTSGGLNFLLKKFIAKKDAEDIFVVMDNDAKLTGKVSQNLQAYFTNSKIGVIGKTGYFIVPDKTDFTLISLHDPFDTPTQVDTIATYFSAFRKEVLQYGFIDKRFESYIYGGGDFDLCLNIKLHGWDIFYDPRFPVDHVKRGSSSLFGNDVINRQILETNRELDQKWRPNYPQVLEVKKDKSRVKKYLLYRKIKSYKIYKVLHQLKNKLF